MEVALEQGGIVVAGRRRRRRRRNGEGQHAVCVPRTASRTPLPSEA
jgi:hypothetical protein